MDGSSKGREEEVDARAAAGSTPAQASWRVSRVARAAAPPGAAAARRPDAGRDAKKAAPMPRDRPAEVRHQVQGGVPARRVASRASSEADVVARAAAPAASAVEAARCGEEEAGPPASPTRSARQW